MRGYTRLPPSYDDEEKDLPSCKFVGSCYLLLLTHLTRPHGLFHKDADVERMDGRDNAGLAATGPSEYARDNAAVLVGGIPVGSNFHFAVTFMISFVFSVVGYLVCYCLSPNWGGRCGATGGFGLQLFQYSLLMIK